jgi:hypothetical protein
MIEHPRVGDLYVVQRYNGPSSEWIDEGVVAHIGDVLLYMGRDTYEDSALFLTATGQLMSWALVQVEAGLRLVRSTDG